MMSSSYSNVVFIPLFIFYFFFFNDTATTEIYTLSLHDALPISRLQECERQVEDPLLGPDQRRDLLHGIHRDPRSEEHTSELQSQSNLVCRLLLEKKKKAIFITLRYLESIHIHCNDTSKTKNKQ